MSEHDFSYLNDDEFVDFIADMTALVAEHNSGIYEAARTGFSRLLVNKKIPKSLQFLDEDCNCVFDCATFEYTNARCSVSFMHGQRNVQIAEILNKFKKVKER